MRKYLGIGVAVLMCVNSAYAAYIPTRLDNLHIGAVSAQSATSNALEADVAVRLDSTLEVNGVTTLADDETLTNASDTLTLAGDDNDTTLAVKGFEAKDAALLLQADESDDNGDDWKIESDQATNSLIVSNDTSGSQAAKLTVTTAGNVSVTGEVDVTGIIEAGSGNHELTDAAGLIDGEKIQDDTIDDDSIDFADVTGIDLTLTDCGQITTSTGKLGITDSQGNLNYDLIVTTVIATGNAYPLTPADGKAGSFIVIAGTFTATGSFTSAAAVTLGLSSTDTSTTDDNAGTVNVYDGGTIVYVENQIGASLTATIRYNYVN